MRSATFVSTWRARYANRDDAESAMALAMSAAFWWRNGARHLDGLRVLDQRRIRVHRGGVEGHGQLAAVPVEDRPAVGRGLQRAQALLEREGRQRVGVTDLQEEQPDRDRRESEDQNDEQGAQPSEGRPAHPRSSAVAVPAVAFRVAPRFGTRPSTWMTWTAPGGGSRRPSLPAAATMRSGAVRCAYSSCFAWVFCWSCWTFVDSPSTVNEDWATIAFNPTRPSMSPATRRAEQMRNSVEWRRARRGEVAGRSAGAERRWGDRRAGEPRSGAGRRRPGRRRRPRRGAGGDRPAGRRRGDDRCAGGRNPRRCDAGGGRARGGPGRTRGSDPRGAGGAAAGGGRATGLRLGGPGRGSSDLGRSDGGGSRGGSRAGGAVRLRRHSGGRGGAGRGRSRTRSPPGRGTEGRREAASRRVRGAALTARSTRPIRRGSRERGVPDRPSRRPGAWRPGTSGAPGEGGPPDNDLEVKIKVIAGDGGSPVETDAGDAGEGPLSPDASPGAGGEDGGGVAPTTPGTAASRRPTRTPPAQDKAATDAPSSAGTATITAGRGSRSSRS